MRLIDIDQLQGCIIIKPQNEYELALIHNCECKITHQDIPTAFDLNKIINQLKEEQELSYADFTRYVNEVCPELDDEYDDFFHRGIERSIKTIKDGVCCEKI